MVFSFQLKPFSKESFTDPFKIQGSGDIQAGALNLKWVMEGPINQLIIPELSAKPKQTDKLWEHTCFEIFFGVQGETSYEEWNFSPSGDWAHYSFSDYRKPVEGNAEKDSPKTIVKQSENKLEFSVNGLSLNNPKQLGFSVASILESRDGKKSYWALEHCAIKPDFHKRESFVLKLKP